MRWLLAVLLVASCGHACAAAVPLALPANVAAAGTSYVTSASAAFSGAAFNSGLTTQVAGKVVTVPAAWRLASNAGQVAAAAVRLNPTALVAGAVATWLIGYGLQWVNGQWVKKDTSTDGYLWWNSVYGEGTTYTGYQAACQGAFDWRASSLPDSYKPLQYEIVQSSATVYWCYTKAASGQIMGSDVARRTVKCSDGSSPVNGVCPAANIPAGDSDFSKITSITDAAASQLSAAKVSLPLTPAVDPATQVVPLSDPYVDPVTGKRYRDVAYVTPSPSSPTKTADLQVAKQEVDADGNPIVDPTTGGVKAPEKTDDPCLAHPDRIGCMDKGEIPEGPDLAESEKTITITPDSGWGPETMACPADIVNTLRSGGGVVAYSFKAQCEFADGVRAPVIAIAWVVAVLIALGVGSKGGGD